MYLKLLSNYIKRRKIMVSKRFLTLVLLIFLGSIIFNFSQIREKHLTLKELCDISEDIICKTSGGDVTITEK